FDRRGRRRFGCGGRGLGDLGGGGGVCSGLGVRGGLILSDRHGGLVGDAGGLGGFGRGLRGLFFGVVVAGGQGQGGGRGGDQGDDAHGEILRSSGRLCPGTRDTGARRRAASEFAASPAGCRTTKKGRPSGRPFRTDPKVRQSVTL